LNKWLVDDRVNKEVLFPAYAEGINKPMGATIPLQ
jgi:hypothetical protein